MERTVQQKTFLDFYKRELNYLRNQSVDFAGKHPKIAGRLDLGSHESSDPHVERLLESFSFQVARVQQSLESEFPQITSALLSNLYPQFLQPVPSVSIAQFCVDKTKPFSVKDKKEKNIIKKETPLFIRAEGTKTKEICRFRTCSPVTLWPLEVESVNIEPVEKYHSSSFHKNTSAILKLRLKITGKKNDLQKLDISTLRFYLNDASTDSSLIHQLYEILMSKVSSISILPDNQEKPTSLRNCKIKPVGFGEDEYLFPYPENAHSGYRLLQEYFTFPEKFLFFDIDNLDIKSSEQHFDLLFLLDQSLKSSFTVDKNMFALGCTPIVNLFSKTTEPIRLDYTKDEYRLIPDSRKENTTEIHSILSVSTASSSKQANSDNIVAPFFSFNHLMEQKEQKTFWNSRQVSVNQSGKTGTDLYLSFLDLDFSPMTSGEEQILYAHTLCTNRSLAEGITPNSLLSIETENQDLASTICLKRPTSPRYPPAEGKLLWQLISLLSLNQLSLSNDEKSLDAFKELLLIFSSSNNITIQREISGIKKMETRTVLRRTQKREKQSWKGFCRGTEVLLSFDLDHYTESNVFLFASVLNRFFALYSSVNAFTQLVIKDHNRDEIWHRWEPETGEQNLL
jgi:type VI secretion system protein ImpG